MEEFINAKFIKTIISRDQNGLLSGFHSLDT